VIRPTRLVVFFSNIVVVPKKHARSCVAIKLSPETDGELPLSRRCRLRLNEMIRSPPALGAPVDMKSISPCLPY